MLRPAAVSAAAAVVWLLTVLGPGLFYPAEATSETGFTHCSHSFYRQMAPQGASVGSLRPLCHTQPGGRSFATLYQPTCDSAVYSAFHLRNGLADSAREDVAEPVVRMLSVRTRSSVNISSLLALGILACKLLTL